MIWPFTVKNSASVFKNTVTTWVQFVSSMCVFLKPLESHDQDVNRTLGFLFVFPLNVDVIDEEIKSADCGLGRCVVWLYDDILSFIMCIYGIVWVFVWPILISSKVIKELMIETIMTFCTDLLQRIWAKNFSVAINWIIIGSYTLLVSADSCYCFGNSHLPHLPGTRLTENNDWIPATSLLTHMRVSGSEISQHLWLMRVLKKIILIF